MEIFLSGPEFDVIQKIEWKTRRSLKIRGGGGCLCMSAVSLMRCPPLFILYKGLRLLLVVQIGAS